MYFAFIYDHNYMKSDRDFYGDAIICFHPIECKETYLYLIGQMIGTIDFFKQFTSTHLNQFKLDKLIVTFRPIIAQFSLIFATDQSAFYNEVMMKKKANLLYDLLKLVHGPVESIDRTDENRYAQFKSRIDDLFKNCFNLVVKYKRIPPFNSYFSSVDFNLQASFESKCKLLMNYSEKKFQAFTGVLFYNEKVFYSKIKSHFVMNLLHLLTCEDNLLVEKCEPTNENQTLPSGCYLIRVNLSRRMLTQLLHESDHGSGDKKSKTMIRTSRLANQDEQDETNEQQEANTSMNDQDQSDDEDENSSTTTGDLNNSNINNTNKRSGSSNNNNELTMDGLPESTRFTTSLSMSLANELMSVVDAEAAAAAAGCDDDAESESFDAANMTQIGVYVQKNSRLKIILLSADILETALGIDKTIQIWQRIVSTFSNLECELMEEERRKDTSSASSSSSSSSNSASKRKNSNSSTPTSLVSLLADREPPPSVIYSCLIDKSRNIKYSSISASIANLSSTASSNNPTSAQNISAPVAAAAAAAAASSNPLAQSSSTRGVSFLNKSRSLGANNSTSSSSQASSSNAPMSAPLNANTLAANSSGGAVSTMSSVGGNNNNNNNTNLPTNAILTNVNLFHELLQSMPEISKLEIR